MSLSCNLSTNVFPHSENEPLESSTINSAAWKFKKQIINNIYFLKSIEINWTQDDSMNLGAFLAPGTTFCGILLIHTKIFTHVFTVHSSIITSPKKNLPTNLTKRDFSFISAWLVDFLVGRFITGMKISKLEKKINAVSINKEMTSFWRNQFSEGTFWIKYDGVITKWLSNYVIKQIICVPHLQWSMRY